MSRTHCATPWRRLLLVPLAVLTILGSCDATPVYAQRTPAADSRGETRRAGVRFIEVVERAGTSFAFPTQTVHVVPPRLDQASPAPWPSGAAS